jgi:hypothetical protein
MCTTNQKFQHPFTLKPYTEPSILHVEMINITFMLNMYEIKLWPLCEFRKCLFFSRHQAEGQVYEKEDDLKRI